MLGHVHADALAKIEEWAAAVRSGLVTFNAAIGILMKRYSDPKYLSFEINRGDFEFELQLAISAPITDDFPPRDAIKKIMVGNDKDCITIDKDTLHVLSSPRL